MMKGTLRVAAVLAAQGICAMSGKYRPLVDLDAIELTPAWQQLVSECVETVHMLNTDKPRLVSGSRASCSIELSRSHDATMQAILFECVRDVQWRGKRTLWDRIIVNDPPWAVLHHRRALSIIRHVGRPFNDVEFEKDLRTVIGCVRRDWRAEYNESTHPGKVRLVHAQPVVTLDADMSIEPWLVYAMIQRFGNFNSDAFKPAGKYSSVLVEQSTFDPFQNIFGFDIKGLRS